MRKLHGWAAAGILTAVVAGLAFAEPAAPPGKPADKNKPAVKDKEKPRERPITIPGASRPRRSSRKKTSSRC